MARYLLIETRTTWDSGGVRDFLALAEGLAEAGASVDLFLIQNGVLMAYPGVEPLVERLLRCPGLTIWVDDFSLATRRLASEPVEGLRIAGIEALVDLMAQPGSKPVWH